MRVRKWSNSRAWYRLVREKSSSFNYFEKWIAPPFDYSPSPLLKNLLQIAKEWLTPSDSKMTESKMKNIVPVSFYLKNINVQSKIFEQNLAFIWNFWTKSFI